MFKKIMSKLCESWVVATSQPFFFYSERWGDEDIPGAYIKIVFYVPAGTSVEVIVEMKNEALALVKEYLPEWDWREPKLMAKDREYPPRKTVGWQIEISAYPKKEE